MNSKHNYFKKSLGTKSRRKFISSCAACGACIAITPLALLNSSSCKGINEKMRLRIIYSLPGPKLPYGGWPNIGFNFVPVMDNFNNILIKQCPGFEFLPTTASGAEDGEKILSQDENENISGYIVFHMHGRSQVVPTIVKSGKPILYVNYLYGGSGAFLGNVGGFLRNKNSEVGFVSSSDVEDLVAAVKCFEVIEKGGSSADFVAAVTKSRINLTPEPGDLHCINDELKTLSIDECQRRIKESNILAFRNQNSGPAEPVMGIPLEYLSFAELNHAWEIADKDEARAIAEKWQKTAADIIDVTFETLQNSACMYLGMKSLLKEHNANAITINCLGGFYGEHIHAYPCLGFHELNNDGLVGACECDIRSTATMVAFTTLTGRPGYISDPVIDTSKRTITYAHCVAPNKMFGPDGPTNPFIIMTHSEDRKGASIRSILPLGYLTTSLKIDNDRKEIIFHQAKAIANDPDDRACRTKLCAEPIGDIEKLFTMWDQWGWHRVTFYGDLKEPVYAFADAIGWKVVEEA